MKRQNSIWPSLFLIFVFASCSGSNGPAPTALPEPTLSAEFQMLVLRTLPPRNWSGAPIAKVDVYPSYINVSFSLNTADSPLEMRKKALIEIADLAQLLGQETKNTKQLRFEGWHMLKDKYGQSELSRVVTVWLDSETLQKINWPNFEPENIPEIADFYLELPGLRRSSF